MPVKKYLPKVRKPLTADELRNWLGIISQIRFDAHLCNVNIQCLLREDEATRYFWQKGYGWSIWEPAQIVVATQLAKLFCNSPSQAVTFETLFVAMQRSRGEPWFLSLLESNRSKSGRGFWVEGEYLDHFIDLSRSDFEEFEPLVEKIKWFRDHVGAHSMAPNRRYPKPPFDGKINPEEVDQLIRRVRLTLSVAHKGLGWFPWVNQNCKLPPNSGRS